MMIKYVEVEHIVLNQANFIIENSGMLRDFYRIGKVIGKGNFYHLL